MTGQAARHNAASKALEQLRQLPIPEEVANTCTTGENGTLGESKDPIAELKSPVSLVYEKALKHGLPVSFEVVSEIGKPHNRTFRTKCTVGDKVTFGEGPSKKVSLLHLKYKGFFIIEFPFIIYHCYNPGVKKTRGRIYARRA